MSVSIIFGTRPEIIKMSPVIRWLEKRGMDFFILHTGQHYSYNLDRVFLEELGLPDPKYNLEAGSGTHAEQTARILVRVERVLIGERPEIVLVHGDTNTTLAGALSASKLHIPVGHVEAGLRSFDREMPEEINRILTDHLSDVLFPPTEWARRNLLREGFEERKVHVTGNTIVDALLENLPRAPKKGDVLGKIGLEEEYILATFHREENVESGKRLRDILEGLKLVSERLSLPIVTPLHPRTLNKIRTYRLNADFLKIVEPLGYLDFLALETNARLIITDSGGIQEEVCILRVPCVTLRRSTERPETLKVGANVLVGTDATRILEGAEMMIDKERDWPNPFGDGRARERIVKVLELMLEGNAKN